MNEYYVYVYLDPRKKGEYNYGEYSFDYEPFYVGKGKKSRYLRHLKTSEWNPLKNNKINKIKNDGYDPIIIKISSNLSNEDAICLEIEVIKLIGKITTKTGSLTNISDGGESYTGYKHKQEYLDKLNKPVIKYDLDGNIIEKYSSVKEAGEKNKVHQQTISNICRGSIKIWKDKYIFKYKDDEFETRNRNKKEYPVYRIDYKNDIIEYKSAVEASLKNDISSSKIGQVCMGDRFQTGGFLWRYKSHPNIDNINQKINSNFGEYLKLLNKKIIDKDGTIYDNILHAISLKRNLKVNNLISLIKAKNIYKYYEYQTT